MIVRVKKSSMASTHRASSQRSQGLSEGFIHQKGSHESYLGQGDVPLGQCSFTGGRYDRTVSVFPISSSIIPKVAFITRLAMLVTN